jgi:natural product biosynthesis luciferase-like monooxygenase protein
MIEDVYPLSPLQEGLYFHWLSNPGSTAYFEQTSFQLKGKLTIKKVEESYRELIARHAVLRTFFTQEIGERLLQVVRKEVSADFNHQDIAGDEHFSIAAYKESDRKKGFDLNRGSQMRLTVLHLGDDTHEFIWSFHHIVMDGWCVGILIREFFQVYNSLIQNKPAALEKVYLYSTYINWLNKITPDESYAYWKNYLSGYDRITTLPKKLVNEKQNYKGEEAIVTIDKEVRNRMRTLCAESGITENTFIQTVWGVLLAKYNNTNDAVFGSVVSGRPAEVEGIEKMIGLFINTIPLRVISKKEISIRQLLKEVQQSSIDGAEHHYVQLAKIQAESELSQGLFDHILMFQNFPVHEMMEQSMDAQSASEKITLLSSEVVEQTNYDFTLIVIPMDTFSIKFKYNANVYNEQVIEGLKRHLLYIIEQAIQDPDILIRELNLVTEEERQKLLVEFNSTDATYPWDKTMLDLFEKQVAKTPDAIAVIFEDTKLSYRELDERSNQLGHYLRTSGVKEETLVPICMERGMNMLIGLLGILKAGGAYVPVDPQYPAERVAYMLENTGAGLVLSSRKSKSRITVKQITLIDMDADWKTISKEPVSAVHTSLLPENMAYMIYTSGSTGNPKGVMIEHRNLVNFIFGMDKQLPLNSSDHLLSITSISFDISILELFWTLCRGILITINRNSESLSGFNKYTNEHPVQLDFSLFYFSSQENGTSNKYDLLMRSTEFADANGFSAVWLPERHFHEFGGIFPNPSVLGAGLAAITKHIGIRSGSIVLPLHDTIRVAEEWSVVDNLSQGRVALSIASGWHANDFVLKPENYDQKQAVMYKQIEELTSLWKGAGTKRLNGTGQEIEVKTYPRPVQSELPIYITAAGSPETFKSAGKIGAKILTHLLGQEMDQLETNIRVYKQAILENGHGPEKAGVVLMLHTYIGEDMEKVKEEVRTPFKSYLKSSLSLLHNLVKNLEIEIDLRTIDEADLDDLLEIAFERYWQTAALLGTVESCSTMVEKLYAIGVTEIACLIDFGIDDKKVMEGLMYVNTLQKKYAKQQYPINPVRNEITALQITPSYLKTLTGDEHSRLFLKSLKHLIIGGEKLTRELVKEVSLLTNAALYNMYGPTETTIWSASKKIIPGTHVTIGKPIQNTKLYILDQDHNLSPIGFPGELFIAGEGLSRGYYNEKELTDARFIQNPFSTDKSARMYQTGDIGRWLPSGEVVCMGRNDNQVKIRGHRIETGEIENVLLRMESVAEAVVMVKENGGDNYLTAYIVSAGNDLNTSDLKEQLKLVLPEYMIPSFFVQLEQLPLTPNGKIDKAKLPQPQQVSTREEYVPARNETEEKLITLWQEVLGMERVGIKDNFFDIGGHSLTAIQLLSKMNKSHFKISMAQLIVNPTVEKIAEHLDRHSTVKKPDTSVFPLKEIKQEGRTSIYFIPPDLGTPLVFKKLVNLLEEDYNYYGFQYQGFNSGEEYETSIRSIAEKFIREIKLLQPAGPYTLFGYSMGISVALEMARQLEKTEEPLVLILLDGSIDHSMYKETIFDDVLQQQRIKRYFPNDSLSQDEFMRLGKFSSHNIKINRQYKWEGVLKSKIICIEARKSGTKMERLRSLTSGSFEHVVVPGDHHSVLEPAHVEALSHAVNGCLKENAPLEMTGTQYL